MMNLRKLLVIVVFVLITSACGPIYSPTLPGPIFIYTETPISTQTPPAASTSIPATPSPSPAVAELAGSYFTLTIDSNCYDGPGESYNVVVKIPSGLIVEVIGRNRDNTWWRIFEDTLADCWVANETGTFVGEFLLIPITSSQFATKAWTPLPSTQENQSNDEVANSGPSGSSNNTQPTNPPPTQPPAATEPPTEPPAETEPPPPQETEPPPPLVCQLLPCPP